MELHMADLATLLSSFREETTNTLAAVAGGLVSMKFTPGDMWQRLTSVPVGFACAVFFTHPVIMYFNVPYESPEKDGASFLVGLFGYTIMHKLFDAVQGIDAAAISSIITRVAGSKVEK
jgi:hypothetical protein